MVFKSVLYNYINMPTLCLTCLVYTLENKPVEENKYIDMFTMFTSQLLKIWRITKGGCICSNCR